MVLRETAQAKPHDNLAQLEAMDAYFAWRRTAATPTPPPGLR
jgi:hypothetical protein